ncbi:hypothetical protein LQ564_25355 [Massilia sp. G4R7]|uniref:Tetratricopeptide repeat protein n=1 Tax=Massilia phyllostachyos TaxID=2898585 RepID=A0ABS8QEG3_9BURK|nr:hypothetical protein [Massilia phyllostachyos]MCD2519637.1 hypothetical protein [Massilia phyllostachyos]
MAWASFPYPDEAYRYTVSGLHKAWRRLHAGDAESWPDNPAVTAAWIAFHAGRFEDAQAHGLEAGLAGYAVANKAACIHAVYLERSEAKKSARLLEVVERCEQQRARQPSDPAGFYWYAYALGRHAQAASIVKALAQGIGGKVRTSLETALALAPRHADAHTALGVYHAEVIDKVGTLLGGLSHGASRDEAIRHFDQAIAIHPGSVIARVEYASALVMLDGRKGARAAIALYEEAAAMRPHDAMERLDVERARQALEE